MKKFCTVTSALNIAAGQTELQVQLVACPGSPRDVAPAVKAAKVADGQTVLQSGPSVT